MLEITFLLGLTMLGVALLYTTAKGVLGKLSMLFLFFTSASLGLLYAVSGDVRYVYMLVWIYVLLIFLFFVVIGYLTLRGGVKRVFGR